MSVAEELQEALECRTAFVIPIFGGIPVPESCVVTWGIMAVLVIASIIFVRRLKKVPTGSQCLVEMLVEWMNKFILDTLGPKGKKYLPFLETMLIYIGISNMVGLFGFRPPTKDIGVTAALALISIVLVQVCGIKEKGFKGWLHSFIEPMPLMAFMNILELGIKPLSLCMRLFGNVLGAFVIMELITMLLPVGLPLPFSLILDVGDGLLQAYVFVFLTSLYISEAIEEEEN